MTAADDPVHEHPTDEQWGTPEGRAMIELLWDRASPSARGPKQRLSLDQIVSAAVELADKDGIDAISMRKVAASLRVGAMSLYTYVPGRDELFELMIDRVYGERRLADPSTHWRTQVDFHAKQAWQMYQRHPWLVWSNLWRMPLGPHVLDVEEDLYRAVLTIGLSPTQTVRVAGLVESFVFGTARGAIVETRQAAKTGVSSDEYWNSRASFWQTHYTPERFPSMTMLWENHAFDEPHDNEAEFPANLAVLLDGIESQLKQP